LLAAACEETVVENFRMRGFFLLAAWLLAAATASAQLLVSVSPVKVAGSKAVVKLELRNTFAEKIESARATVFLMDEQGKMAGQATRWVIGGTSTNGLPAGATNAFHFVITSDKPFTTTNLTPKVTFSRIVLDGDRLADLNRDVQVSNASK
jgi:hypothetical protein